LLFFHPDTPSRYYADLLERFSVCFATSTEEMLAVVNVQLRQATSPVVTTRLDNDDSLGRRFVGVTRSVASTIAAQADLFGLPHVITYRFGVERDVRTGIVAERHYATGPFVSLVERVEAGTPLHTAFARPHYEMHQAFANTVIANRLPMWAINVHGGNVANRVKGMVVADAVRRRQLLAEFPNPPLATGDPFARENPEAAASPPPKPRCGCDGGSSRVGATHPSG
jgi:hypothetical protein